MCQLRFTMYDLLWDGQLPSQEVFLTPHHLGIAMEYVEGGDLAQWVQTHRIPEVRGTPNAWASTPELAGI